MTQLPHAPKRADAQQNRERIIEVAREAFAAAGDASLNSIAKAAGVGPGTLYRHFPNRDALVLAVYQLDIQRLADAAPRLLAELPPLAAMRRWFDQLARYGQMKHGVADVLHAASSASVVDASYGPVVGAVAVLLRAGQEAGQVHTNVTADDVLLLLGFLWRISPGPDAEAQAGRLLDLIMDGLQARTPGEAGPGRGRG